MRARTLWAALATTAVLFWLGTLALYLFGTIGALTYYRVTTFGSLVVALGSLATSRSFRLELERWEALAEQQHEMLSSIRAVPTVRCAGCHLAAALLGRGTTDEGEEGFLAPPDWELRDERPYCPTCLAKEVTQ